MPPFSNNALISGLFQNINLILTDFTYKMVILQYGGKIVKTVIELEIICTKVLSSHGKELKMTCPRSRDVFQRKQKVDPLLLTQYYSM